MKRIVISLVLALVAALTMTVPAMAATDPPDSDPQVISIKVYRNLRSQDDRLFVIYANVPYATIPDKPFSDTFIWQLISPAGAVLGSTTGYSYVNSGYGYGVYSLYFDADAALAWSPEPNYTVRLIGNPVEFASPPKWNYPLDASNFSTSAIAEESRAELSADILNIADDLDLQWGLSYSLLAEDETGTTLSTFGQAYFRGSIYSVQVLAPDLFPLAYQDVTVTDREWGNDFEQELAEQYQGSWIDTAKTAGGMLFGVEYDLLSVIIVLVLVFGVIIGNIKITNTYWDGLIDASLILVVATRAGLLGLGYLILIAAICFIYTAMRIWRIPG